ncbi:MAG: polysaccharide deacetylase family protein [Lachnospiraceae bacterium]
MEQSDRRKENGQEARGSFFQEAGGRLLKSLLFWGLAIFLTLSAYTDMKKICSSGSVQREAESPRAAAIGKECAETQKAAAGEARTVTDDGNTGTAASDGNAADADMQRKQIALTFDDGPHPRFTKLLLDGLAQRKVPATFFVVGKNIPGNEELIRRMDQEGHLIGNHTYDHVKISDMGAAQACEQVEKTSALVREITGKDTEFVRPPFGEWNKDMECSFTMIPVLWSIDPLDWTTENTALIEERILSDAEEGDIILMHDYYQSSVDAALDVVDVLLEQGYELVTVDKLILE